MYTQPTFTLQPIHSLLQVSHPSFNSRHSHFPSFFFFAIPLFKFNGEYTHSRFAHTKNKRKRKTSNTFTRMNCSSYVPIENRKVDRAFRCCSCCRYCWCYLSLVFCVFFFAHSLSLSHSLFLVT